METRHYIARVQDSINNYREVQTSYFDGTEDQAEKYFREESNLTTYFGNNRYQIIMQANATILQWPD